MNLDNLLKETIIEINKDNKFTKDFKNFSEEAAVIIKLCKIYEEGTGRKITKENIDNDMGILSFIKNISPLLQGIGIELTMSEKMMKSLIIGLL